MPRVRARVRPCIGRRPSQGRSGAAGQPACGARGDQRVSGATRRAPASRPATRSTRGPYRAAGPNANGGPQRPSRATALRERLSARVLLAETIDADRRVHHLLLARVRTGGSSSRLRSCRFSPSVERGLERVPTAAGHGDRFVVGMDSALHGRGPWDSRREKRARSIGGPPGPDRRAFSQRPTRVGYRTKMWILCGGAFGTAPRMRVAVRDSHFGQFF